jgi:hypothetical protein
VSLSFLEKPLGGVELQLGRDSVRATRRWLGREITTLTAPVEDAGSEALLRAAAALLAREELRGAGRRLQVSLSAGLVRYILLPWSEQRLSAAQREAIATALFAERYGQPAGGYAVVLEGERFRQPTLAAGIERTWLDALRDLAGNSGFRLISLVPGASQRINHLLKQIETKAPCGWLVLADDGQLLSLAFERQRWLQVHSERLPAGQASLASRLEAVLRRDAVRHAQLLQGRVFMAGGEPPGQRLAGLWEIVSVPVPVAAR